MHADPVGDVDGFLAGDADSILLRLDLEVLFIDPRQLDDREQILSLLKHVDGRESPATRRQVLKPVARALPALSAD